MVGYTALESAVVARFLAHYPTELNAARCKAGDMDGVFEAMLTEDAGYGVWFEFGGGRQQPRPGQTLNHWVWAVVGVFVIRFDADIEANLRAVADKLATVFDSDRTLGYKTPLAELIDVAPAEPATVNDIPFYWLPFVIEVLDR